MLVKTAMKRLTTAAVVVCALGFVAQKVHFKVERPMTGPTEEGDLATIYVEQDVTALDWAGTGISKGADTAHEEVILPIVKASLKGWEGIKANPAPFISALVVFVLTFLFWKSRGATFRQAVEAAATRVAPVPVVSPALKRANTRAAKMQLLTDQIGIQNRLRELPGKIKEAERDVCHAQKARDEAKTAHETQQKVFEESEARLAMLRKELEEKKAEGDEIAEELEKLA
jgi:hypothetical protein